MTAKGKATTCYELLCHHFFPTGCWATLVHLVSLCWPIILTQLALVMFGFISIPFIGRLGKDALAAVGISTAIVNVCGNSALLGLSSACETLMSQAHGKQDLKRIGIVFQQSIWIGFLACAPIATIVLIFQNFFRFLSVSEEVVDLTETYILIYLPAFPLNVIYLALMKFLQCQLVVIPCVIACIVANAFNILLHYIFIVHLSMGVAGSAIAIVLSTLLFCAILLFFILQQRLHVGVWNGFSKEAFLHWSEYLKLAIPGMIMICLQWWAFEIGMIACALVDEINLSSNVILVQVMAFTLPFYFGLGIATSIAVGNELGCGRPDVAKTVANVSFLISVPVGVFFFLILLLGESFIPQLFTNIPDVLNLTGKVMPVCAILQMGDSVANTSNGVIRGCGRQKVGAILNFVGYYVIALPVGLSLLSPAAGGMGVLGFWIGQVFAQFVQSTSLLCYQCCSIDWEVETRDALHRVRSRDSVSKDSPTPPEKMTKKTTGYGVADIIPLAAFPTPSPSPPSPSTPSTPPSPTTMGRRSKSVDAEWAPLMDAGFVKPGTKRIEREDDVDAGKRCADVYRRAAFMVLTFGICGAIGFLGKVYGKKTIERYLRGT